MQRGEINIYFNGCTGLDGTAVFSALQTVTSSINFSGCTSLSGITLENCVISATNLSKFNLTNTGITTVDLSGSELSGTLNMTSLTNLTTLILTGCTGTSELKLHTSRQGLVNITNKPADVTIIY
ncbi:MAG: hypothetical protein LBL30_03410 [Holosporales bacterium]|nr:hypothetical protein [Holosporales bacterium]